MKSIILLLFILTIAPASYGCFGAIASSMSQGISQQYEMQKQRSESLMKLAEQRTKIEKECRGELLKALIDFRKRRVELQRKIAKEPVKIEDAEINYEIAVAKLKSECEKTANDEFKLYKENAYSVPVGDPTAIASFEQRVNKGWITLYTNCWRGQFQGGGDNARQQQVKLLARKLANAISQIREEINDAKEELRELHAQTQLIQSNTQLNCRDARNLQDYNERVTEQIHAQGMAAASQMQQISTLGAVMSCLSPQGNNNSNGTQNNNMSL